MTAQQTTVLECGGPAPARAPAVQPRGMRIEIQGLRALAVVSVVLYHVTPARLPGGYVGVDVFFVVSGFLITGHLLREVEVHGRIRLSQFWARRARRLLPAALLTLLTSAVAVFLWVPETLWQQFLEEIGAAALYVENWVLAANAVDYLAAKNVASPAQHYWSLSTEEQFYLVWPLLITAAIWAAARFATRFRVTVATVLATVTVASFGYSLWATVHSPSSAYFVTPARAWQFGLGGLLAIAAGSSVPGRERARALASWAGFAAIGLATVTFSAATPFPGTAALLPVLGATTVIWAGAPRARWSPTRVAEISPVRFLGDISYSAYLWHWPLVVLLPYVLGHPLGTASKAGILVTTVLAAWITKVAVEDPMRSSGLLLRRQTRTTFLTMLTATGVVVATTASGWWYVDARVTAARAAATAVDGQDPCFGAGAMQSARGCAAPFAYTRTVDTSFAKSDLSHGFTCMQNDANTAVKTCRIGSARPSETVALVGDSHTASLYEAAETLARVRNWAVIVYLKAGCPVLGTDRLVGANMPPDQPPACRVWSNEVLRDLADDPQITRVFTSYRSDVYKYVGDDGTLQDAIPAGVVQKPLRGLADAGKKVYVIRAVPTTNGVHTGHDLVDLEVNAPDCIARAPHVDDPCAGPRDARLAPDYLARAASDMHDERVRVLDLTDAFCDARTCHELVGGVIVYFDGSHVTATFSRSLGQVLSAAL